MKYFPVGTTVELLPEYNRIYSAESGARGIIEGQVREEGFDYYQIIWDRTDSRVNGQQDGLVDCHHVRICEEIEDAKKRNFEFSKRLAAKALEEDDVNSFMVIVVKNNNPYVITDAQTPMDAIKIIPDIMAIAGQLTETCIQSIVDAYSTIEKLKKARENLERLEENFDDDEDYF